MANENERRDHLERIDDELERLRGDEMKILERISVLRAERAALVDDYRRELTGVALARAALHDDQLTDRLNNETRAMGERFLEVRRWAVDEQGTVRSWAPIVALDADADADANARRTADEIRRWIKTYADSEPDVPANWRNRGHHLVLVRRAHHLPLAPVWVRRDVDEAFVDDPGSRLHRHLIEGDLERVLQGLRLN